MTKRIEEVLDIGPTKEELQSLPDEWQFEEMPSEYGIEKHDEEMNTIIDAAITAHKDLVEIGMNMEPKNAGELLNPAMKALEIALKASQSKVDSRIKVEKVMIERERSDFDTKKNVEETDVNDGDVETLKGGFVASREDILKNLRESQKKKA